jgi:hypothetical protein
MCGPGVTAPTLASNKSGNRETFRQIFPSAAHHEKHQVIDFKGFFKVGTAPALSLA